MSQPFQPIIPADIEWQQGIPYANQFNDIYFSRDNGLAESVHVFLLGNDLPNRWQVLPEGKPFVIAETGFGTGLNFLLTMRLWEAQGLKKNTLHYYACEKHPLKLADLTKALTFWPELTKYAQQLIESYPALIPGFHSIEFENGVCLTLIFADVVTSMEKLIPSCEGMIDSWYLDGFSPAKNQSMWTPQLFAYISKLSHQQTQLATFSCARMVKDGLVQAGFTYKKTKGYGQKREMIQAIKTNQSNNHKLLKKKSLWEFGQYKKPSKQNALVIGAGLAGCMIAYHLAKLGWQITVLDKGAQPGVGASANPRAVIFPSFSAYDSPLSQIMLQAYPHAIRFYQQFDMTGIEHEFNGMISLEPAETYNPIFLHWLETLSPMVEFLSEAELSKKAGLNITGKGLWFPKSGWINSQQLCQKLLDHDMIDFIGNTNISTLNHDDNHWHVNNHHAEVVILANGWQMKEYSQTNYLPLRTIKGQMTALTSTTQSDLLRVPVCCNGHVLPATDGYHYTGATFEIDRLEAIASLEADRQNLHTLNAIPLDCEWSKEVVNHWCGIRTTINDYMPVVGSIPNQEKFINNFKAFEKDANRFIENRDPFETNLYALTGFGSRGLTTIPLCASYLAKLIANHPLNMPHNLLSAIAPARFLYRRIVTRQNVL
ncbi:bifunctional tRNA (5-methylaminomethyl-2-thiouridine)(34)-methyltransferase MnmD/FAD-dependent 5-carboxymethylaminomethyl-2-thiouridine(34) oxidoreductase MnmC [Legionella sp. W05-934-2]|jgi:tRNA 5-methylaminomethyl-2-thiouridine biosynthesis bifunctional protein|uniref:bifunctional tRNA (5-methylaminomethyl-2-thiouridine)(34)-methyltransferase MnmD/FAD-dependent 5-carboxymethylaminomethyl-2-thiouridine(34) oxidoreductase MnmC n=1 Tax=Legionella sp. W05-934-2 TaxID=1198649 RepID=UPI003462B58F